MYLQPRAGLAVPALWRFDDRQRAVRVRCSIKHTPRANPRGVVAASRKPGSVAYLGHPRHAGGHSSGTSVTERLVQPTQGLGPAALERPSTWPCSGWGLPCRNRYRLRGGLLPHLFTLTRVAGSDAGGLIFCGTFLEVSLTGRYPASCRAEPGLSSGSPLGRTRDRLRCDNGRELRC